MRHVERNEPKSTHRRVGFWSSLTLVCVLAPCVDFDRLCRKKSTRFLNAILPNGPDTIRVFDPS